MRRRQQLHKRKNGTRRRKFGVLTSSSFCKLSFKKLKCAKEKAKYITGAMIQAFDKNNGASPAKTPGQSIHPTPLPAPVPLYICSYVYVRTGRPRASLVVRMRVGPHQRPSCSRRRCCCLGPPPFSGPLGPSLTRSLLNPGSTPGNSLHDPT